MTRSMLTAAMLAAAVVAGPGYAVAADLDYGRYPSDRYSSAYEDPRYGDIYGPPPHARPRPYVEDYRAPPIPPAYVYRDDDRHRYAPRYTELPRGQPPYRDGCLPREEIKRRLISEGWREFTDLEIRGDVAEINARRPNGDVYFLRVDRCSGDIVSSRFLERGYGPYANDNGGRWTRPYY